MKKKCTECDFEADDETYKFEEYEDGTILCGNCADGEAEEQDRHAWLQQESSALM